MKHFTIRLDTKTLALLQAQARQKMMPVAELARQILRDDSLKRLDSELDPATHNETSMLKNFSLNQVSPPLNPADSKVMEYILRCVVGLQLLAARTKNYENVTPPSLASKKYLGGILQEADQITKEILSDAKEKPLPTKLESTELSLNS